MSCGRDRVWALFKRAAPDSFEFATIVKQNDAHLRIIWGITWSHDDAIIATASRDKKQCVKFWKGKSDKPGELHSELPKNAGETGATAITFFPGQVRERYSVVVGLESGQIMVWTLVNANTWEKLYDMPTHIGHFGAVRRLKFRPGQDLTLATCADDHSVRLYEIAY